jgi:DNA polymerase-1
VFKVKDVFIARSGYTMVSMDYKQAEMRLASFYAEEETMANLIRNGEDIPSSTAKTLGIPRDAAKRINFGVIYGIGADSLSETLRIPRPTAAGYLKQYHNLYPGFRRLMNACESYANNHSFIRMWTGRKRHYDRANPTHKAMSNLVQGGVAEIMRVTILKLAPVVRDLQGYMLLQVHDNVVFEIPDENVMTAIPILKSIMEDMPFDPAMVVDVSYGKRWGEMQEWQP